MPNRTLTLSAVVALAVFLSASAPDAWAQLDKGQQKCVNALNKDGALVAKTQGKEQIGCLTNAAKGKLTGTAQDCLTADAKGKVQKKKNKTLQDEAKSCAPPPSFGYTSATAVNDAAVAAELDLIADVFGGDLDAAVITCASSKDGCKCQQAVLKDVEKIAGTKLKEFLKCKKGALKNGAADTADLNDCVADGGTAGSIAADTKGKLGKAAAKLSADIAKKCDAKGVTGAFPGDCDALSGSALGACLDVLVECRVCQMLNEMDGLYVNCDLFDDGTINSSCESGTGPTPTPSVTPSPLPTATPEIFKGALLQNNGHWGEYAPPGQDGGEAQCNSVFPGTHLCTVAELQAAEAEGELVGAVDQGNNAITGFWAVEPAADNFDQCISDGGTVRWLYATAHTASKGDTIALNNGTGALGPVVSGASCAGTLRSIGCCATP